MRRYARLIALFVQVSVQNETAYRFDFLFRIVVALLQLCGEFLALWTIFSNTQSLAGWSAPQTIVLLGVFRIMVGLIGLVIAPNMRRIMEDIRNGTLDFALAKPVNTQFLVSFRQVVILRCTDILLGAALVIGGTVALGEPVGLLRIGLFVATLAAGAVIIYSLWLCLATLIFWFTRIDNIEMLFWNVFEAGRYPIDIYRPWIRWTLTFVVPLAFLTTIPAGALVGRAAPTMLLVAVVAAPVALLGASRFWRYGLRHYSGASA